MSFALTKGPVLRQEKDVTRRLGWQFLKVGDYLQPVEKCMGLRPGESLVQIGGPIQVTGLQRERLHEISAEDCAREGFPELTPAEFVAMFCRTHKRCTPDTTITRIQFRYCPTPTETPQ